MVCVVYLSSVVDIPVSLPSLFYTMHNYQCICGFSYSCLSSNIDVWWGDKFCLLLGVLIYHEPQQILWNTGIWEWLVLRIFIWVHIMFVKKTFNECKSDNHGKVLFHWVAISKCICRRDLSSAFVKEYSCIFPWEVEVHWPCQYLMWVEHL